MPEELAALIWVSEGCHGVYSHCRPRPVPQQVRAVGTNSLKLSMLADS